MQWWIWLLFGFGLLVAELLTPGGFYLMFFGISALVIGVLTSASASGPTWLQWMVFSVLSVLSILLFRRPMLERFGPKTGGDVDSLVGERARALDVIPALAEGKVELRGSTWSARNESELAIAIGQACRVEGVQGLTLRVRPE